MLVDGLRELLEHRRMEEEPDAVAEEEIGLGSKDDYVEQSKRVF